MRARPAPGGLPMSGICIQRWSFWSPEGSDPSAWWRHWQKPGALPGSAEPDASVIPPMQRRRMSRLTKMALACALEVTADAGPDYSIFCSQHGEITRTRAILAAIADGEDISPAAFAQSVHNTSSGLYTIISGSHAASTSIAAGANTFASGWLEAEAYLARRPDHTVLLVDFDEIIPDEYRPYVDELQCDHALALLLAGEPGGGITIDRAPPGTPDFLPQGPAFLAWLQGTGTELCLTGEGQGWQWRR